MAFGEATLGDLVGSEREAKQKIWDRIIEYNDARRGIPEELIDTGAGKMARGEILWHCINGIYNDIKEAGYHKEEETYRFCVKTCAILNKIMMDFPEVKLDLYLKSIGQLSRE